MPKKVAKAEPKRTYTLPEVIDLYPSLDEQDRAELQAALCTRGKRKGLLKKDSPACDEPGFAGWQALIGAIQPARISIAGLMSAPPEVRDLYTRLDKWVEARPEFRAFVNARGQRDFEFNLYALTGRAG